jgi:hypothetical protein
LLGEGVAVRCHVATEEHQARSPLLGMSPNT